MTSLESSYYMVVAIKIKNIHTFRYGSFILGSIRKKQHIKKDICTQYIWQHFGVSGSGKI